MKQFSIEQKPLITSAESRYHVIPQLAVLLLLSGAAVSALYVVVGLAYTVNVVAQVAIIACCFASLLIIPLLHRYLFGHVYFKMLLDLDLHFIVSLLMVLLQMDATGYGGCYGTCLAFNICLCLFFVVNTVVMSSTCNHWFRMITALSLVEEEQLLTLDQRRLKIHSAFAANSEELELVRQRYEHIVHANFIIFVLFLVVSTYIDMEQNSLGSAVVHALDLFFISYRNFFFVCQWNSLLQQLEVTNSLTFETLKIRCFGAVMTYEMLVGATITAVGVLFKDAVAAI